MERTSIHRTHRAGSLHGLSAIRLIAMMGVIGFIGSCRPSDSSTGRTQTSNVKPNPPRAVFLIIVDTLRPDRLSCYGYAKHQTPHIDRLASIGLRFAHAQSAASWTTPAVGSILTSLYPTQLGLVESPGLSWEKFEWRQKRAQRSQVFPSSTPTIATVLHDAGFSTAAFVDQPALNFAACYRRGFDQWYSPVGSGQIKRSVPSDDITPQDWESTKYAFRSDKGLVEAFQSWISQCGENDRIFAWVHLLTPHRPYDPPKEYLRAGDDTEDSMRQASNRYDGEVLASDDLVGSLLESIEQHVGFEHSLTIFTADHAEAFGEHGMKEHGHTLHQEVLHVPLIIAGHAIAQGQVIDPQVSTLDLMPTIMDVLGLKAKTPADISGVSMMPFGDKGRRSTLYAEGMLYGSTERAMIRDPFKLMYDEQGEVCALYNIVSDPLELTDISSQNNVMAKKLCEQIKDFHQQLLDDYERRITTSKSSKEDEQERQRAIEALKSLGYVDN